MIADLAFWNFPNYISIRENLSTQKCRLLQFEAVAIDIIINYVM